MHIARCHAIAIMFALGLLLIPQTASQGGDCNPTKPSNLVANADAIFIGHCIQVTARRAVVGFSLEDDGQIKAPIEGDVHVVTFLIVAVLKGPLSEYAKVDVVTPAGTDAGGYSFQQKVDYLVFATHSSDITLSIPSWAGPIPYDWADRIRATNHGLPPLWTTICTLNKKVCG